MQTVDISKCIEGTFVRELKNRFLCEVLIDGASAVCYVPSSCHLSNFLELEGKRVFLIPTEAKNARTKYALFAAQHKNGLIILNTSIPNRIVENYIHKGFFSMLGPRKTVFKEYIINGYKSDFFIADTQTVIEIKSVITPLETASFPTIYSERAIIQLRRISELLKEGYKAHYLIVSLNPHTKNVRISRDAEFRSAFDSCVSRGMKLSSFSFIYNISGIKLKRIHVLEE